MSDSIPALIAELRAHGSMSGHEPTGLELEAADALESLSASPGDDERADLRDLIYHHEYIDGSGMTMRDSEGLRDAILAARRLSALTQEALAKDISLWLMVNRTSNQRSADEQGRDIAAMVMSRYSLPEPAEVEWEYGILHEGWDEWGQTAPTYAQAKAVLATDPCDDCVIVRRVPGRETGPWLPVEEGTK